MNKIMILKSFELKNMDLLNEWLEISENIAKLTNMETMTKTFFDKIL